MTIRVLIAEDDANLRQGLIDLLEGEGYAVEAAADGRRALEAFRRQAPDLVLLDVMMPELSGYDVCRQIRKSDSRTPIIMLTAKGEEIDKVVGLELGADDYVTKPFGLHELRARIAAVLRRSTAQQPQALAGLPQQFAIGQALVDRKTYLVRLGSQTHSLTSRELRLLDIFHARPNEVLSRNDLLNAAWGVDYFGTTRTLISTSPNCARRSNPTRPRPDICSPCTGSVTSWRRPNKPAFDQSAVFARWWCAALSRAFSWLLSWPLLVNLSVSIRLQEPPQKKPKPFQRLESILQSIPEVSPLRVFCRTSQGYFHHAVESYSRHSTDSDRRGDHALFDPSQPGGAGQSARKPSG